MRTPRAARFGIAAGMAATALVLTAGLSAQAATSTSWQVIAQTHYGTADLFNGLLAVAAPSGTDAWAVGGTDLSGGTPGAPVAQNWNGTSWQDSPLPSGLTGDLAAVSAPAADDVWAVSGLAGYVLHWDGTTWSVAQQFPESPPPGQLTGVTAFSPTDVWVFGGPGANPGLGTWHLSGSTWTQVTGLGGSITRASALSPASIWGLGSVNSPGDAIVHLSGGAWQQVTSPALSGLTFQGILAVSAKSIWATAMLGQTPKLVHFNGTAWRRISVPWPVQLGQPAQDGASGLWMNAQSLGSNQTWAVHRSSTGKWTRQGLPAAAGGSLTAIARIPGTTSMWSAGRLNAATGSDATIWGRGPAA